MANYTFKAWGGFVNGRLACLSPSNPAYLQYDEPRFAIFKNKEGAERAYEDVRRIEVTVREMAR